MTSPVLLNDLAADAVSGVSRRSKRMAILGIPLDNLSMEEAVAAILDLIDRPGPAQVCFVNADCVNIASRDSEYRSVLDEADLALADGIGMKLAGLAEGVRLRDNVNGTDLFPRLCAALATGQRRLFLLGARPGVATAVADWIGREHPGVEITGIRHGHFQAEEEPQVIREIAASGADLLLVATGAPRQDLWIRRHLDSLGVKVAVGVGGLFDFYSGRIPRAPLAVRRLGLEWLYRLYQEPSRLWRRYLIGGPRFVLRVVTARRRSA